MSRKMQPENMRQRQSMAYTTSEMQAVIDRVREETNDDALIQSLHFSSTAFTVLRRVMMSNGIIVTDTPLLLSGIDDKLVQQLNLSVECFLDDPQVMSLAEQRKITRAEIATDYALSLPGAKLIVVGSAPMALDKIIRRREFGPLQDVVVLAAPSGYASVIQLKEKICELDIPSIVVRGKKGGTSIARAILNAILDESCKQNW